MSKQIIGLNEVNGSLIAVDNVDDVAFEEVVEVATKSGKRLGRVVELEGNRAIIQVFQGTSELSKVNTSTKFLGHPMEIPVSKELLGRVFNGSGAPIDGLVKYMLKIVVMLMGNR